MCKHINQTGDQRAKSADLRKKLQVWSWQIWKKSLVINLGKLVLCSRDDIDVWGPWGPLAGTSEGPKIWRIKGPKKLECLFGGKVLLLGTVKIWKGESAPPALLNPSPLGPSIIIYTELERREKQEKYQCQLNYGISSWHHNDLIFLTP